MCDLAGSEEVLRSLRISSSGTNSPATIFFLSLSESGGSSGEWASEEVVTVEIGGSGLPVAATGGGGLL